MAQSLTTCTFCGVGCGLYLETSANHISGVCPSRSHPANEGKICVRGWHVHEIASAPDRLKTPLIKKNGQFEKATWEEAIAFITSRLKEVKDKYGPDSIAFLSSPRCSNEEAYLLQKLARSVIGTNNVDHGAGVYSNNSTDVLLDMLGAAATTNALADLAKSDVILVDGVDLQRQLPTIAGAVIRAKVGGAKLIVVGERRQRVAENADWYLQIKPGTEALLYGAMAKIIVDNALMNMQFIQARCRDYEAFLAQVRGYDLLACAEGCGVPAQAIEAAARAFGRSKAASVLYSTGATARDKAATQALVNLVLLTGQIGKAGGGLFALTEHNNLQGSCDVGVAPQYLPGYRSVANAASRGEVEALWGAKLPALPGLSASSVLKDRSGGKVKAAWLLRYDPVSTAAVGTAAKALDECELVVAQHLFLTETAKHAHVILPTTAFGEERVTFTSTERRIQLAERAVEPPSGIFPAWEQLAEVARGLGAIWKYETSADVMKEIGTVVPFYSGASYDNLAQDFGRQWPCTKERPQGTPFLFAEAGAGFKFVAIPKPKAAVETGKDFPFTLVLGNSSYYWNQNVLIAHSETLKREYRMLLLDYPRGFVEISSDDAKQMKIRDGQRIKLCAAGGSATTVARVTPEVRSGTVFVPYQELSQMQQLRGSQSDGSQLLAVRVETEAA
ncbi:MAG TPA: molybdopterin-dependent oxidoreductase [Anaeromyxobacteraceae bacterium]|nr:molybdopterin-dependent oxidoreductase [Anaeromyxobacteraceae bacterium]